MTTLNTRTTARFAAFALAAVMTLGVMFGLDSLATDEHSGVQVAARAQAVQVAQTQARASKL